jgi:hypothetical protein
MALIFAAAHEPGFGASRYKLLRSVLYEKQ